MILFILFVFNWRASDTRLCLTFVCQVSFVWHHDNSKRRPVFHHRNYFGSSRPLVKMVSRQTHKSWMMLQITENCWWWHHLLTMASGKVGTCWRDIVCACMCGWHRLVSSWGLMYLFWPNWAALGHQAPCSVVQLRFQSVGHVETLPEACQSTQNKTIGKGTDLNLQLFGRFWTWRYSKYLVQDADRCRQMQTDISSSYKSSPCRRYQEDVNRPEAWNHGEPKIQQRCANIVSVTAQSLRSKKSDPQLDIFWVDFDDFGTFWTWKDTVERYWNHLKWYISIYVYIWLFL